MKTLTENERHEAQLNPLASPMLPFVDLCAEAIAKLDKQRAILESIKTEEQWRAYLRGEVTEPITS